MQLRENLLPITQVLSSLKEECLSRYYLRNNLPVHVPTFVDLPRVLTNLLQRASTYTIAVAGTSSSPLPSGG